MSATRTANDAALSAFMARRADALAALAKLTAYVEDHMEVDPETLHWGHVGDAGRLAAELDEIVAGTL